MSKKYPDNDGLTSQEYDDAVAQYKQQRAERLRMQTQLSD